MEKDSLQGFIISGNAQKFFEWDKWIKEIPYIQFPDFMQVQIVPPFAASIVRFRVRHKDNVSRFHISVYLDCYDMLGSFGEPYWEIYPYNNDTYRVAMNDTDELINILTIAVMEIEQQTQQDGAEG